MTREDRRRSIAIHENNKAVVAAFYNRCMNGGEVAAVVAVLAPDFVDHSSGLAGVSDMEDFVRESHRRWPVLAYAIEDIIAEGDRVAVRWAGRGTHHTRREANWTGMGFYRLRDGKIAEHWAAAGTLGLVGQLEHPPEER